VVVSFCPNSYKVVSLHLPNGVPCLPLFQLLFAHLLRDSEAAGQRFVALLAVFLCRCVPSKNNRRSGLSLRLSPEICGAVSDLFL